MDQQAFRRAANPGAPGLGVHHHVQRLLRIRGCVQIDMHDTFKMRKDRHTRLTLYQTDKTFAATRNNHVNGIDHGEQFLHRRAIPCRYKLDRRFRQPGSLQPLDQTGMDCAGGMEAL